MSESFTFFEIELTSQQLRAAWSRLITEKSSCANALSDCYFPKLHCPFEASTAIAIIHLIFVASFREVLVWILVP